MKDRYSSMKNFASLIKKNMPLNSFKNMPHFPPKKFIGNKSEDFLKQRMNLLQTFFTNFLRHPEVVKSPNVLIYFRDRAVEKEKVDELVNFLEKKTTKKPAQAGQ